MDRGRRIVNSMSLLQFSFELAHTSDKPVQATCAFAGDSGSDLVVSAGDGGNYGAGVARPFSCLVERTVGVIWVQIFLEIDAELLPQRLQFFQIFLVLLLVFNLGFDTCILPLEMRNLGGLVKTDLQIF